MTSETASNLESEIEARKFLIKANQDLFDKNFITSSEIGRTLGVSRSAIAYARKNGILPDTVKIKGTRAFLWHRETIKPYLDSWKLCLHRKIASRQKRRA